MHHYWNCMQHIRRGWMLRHSLAARFVVNAVANFLWRWNSCGHRYSSMVHHWLLGGRKGLWYYITGLRIRHHDYLDFGMDCGGRSLWKTKSINWKESAGISKAIDWFLRLKALPEDDHECHLFTTFWISRFWIWHFWLKKKLTTEIWLEKILGMKCAHFYLQRQCYLSGFTDFTGFNVFKKFDS